MSASKSTDKVAGQAAPPTIGAVLDGCQALLSSLKTQAERDQVITALLAIHAPAGLKKLSARLPGTGGNATTQHAAAVAAPKEAKLPKKSGNSKEKTPPPKPVAWAKDPQFIELKKVQKEAASALVAAKRANDGKELPADHTVVAAFNSARTAVQNFRPSKKD